MSCFYLALDSSVEISQNVFSVTKGLGSVSCCLSSHLSMGILKVKVHCRVTIRVQALGSHIVIDCLFVWV